MLCVHYHYVKTKMLADFQICISVPLRDLFTKYYPFETIKVGATNLDQT